MENKTKSVIKHEIAIDLPKFTTAEAFQNYLNRDPNKEWITLNKEVKRATGKDVFYIPIEVCQMLLDKLFAGIYRIQNFKWSQIGNELAGTVEIEYLHPVTNIWLKREGSAVVPVQFKSKEKRNDQIPIFDLENKVHNAIQKNIGTLHSECIKNGCHKIGRIFGRDLNRDPFGDDLFESFSDEIKELDVDTIEILDLVETANLAPSTKLAIKQQVNKMTGSKLKETINYLKTKQPVKK